MMSPTKKEQNQKLSYFKKSKLEDFPHLYKGLNSSMLWWCRVKQTRKVAVIISTIISYTSAKCVENQQKYYTLSMKIKGIEKRLLLALAIF